jgi:hypothetical protein
MEKDFVLSLMSNKRSARSLQKAVGPSEIGGCRRQVWHRVNSTPVTNVDTLEMAAWMGTAIHTALENRIERADPFHERYLTELEVSADGIKGHIDVYDRVNSEVIDWKTTTKSKLSSKAYPWPSNQQRMQVHLYGYLLLANDYLVDTVTLVGIPRDGNENHIAIHSEPYDAQIAKDGLAWLKDVEFADSPPEPERNVRFCRDYCQFYDATDQVGCPGLRSKADE